MKYFKLSKQVYLSKINRKRKVKFYHLIDRLIKKKRKVRWTVKSFSKN